MKELEVGMYVRTEKCGICKIYKIQQDLIKYKNNYTEFIDYKSMLFDIRKASHTLLGSEEEPCLIEVGDYVNGERVQFITNKKQLLSDGGYNILEKYNTISSIVTKEQFETMKYIIEK